uniref:Uncharacterized protein n=1 Tax=Tetradesmus obliquus TaxID=3088 RepID=A0A383VM96_TETOB|eukprot:jgi/Sobl393_1/4146/SZX65536.1
MTLLIAIINHTYQPEFVEKETVVMQAETVECYHQQVRHGLAPAPANILQVLLLWLPNGFRGHRMWLSDTWGAAALEPDPNSRAGSGRPSTSDPMPQSAATKQPSSMGTLQQLRHFASRNAAAVSLRLSGRLGGGQGSWQRARRAAVLGLLAAGSPDTAAKLVMSAPSSSRAAAGGSPRVTFAQSAANHSVCLQPTRHCNYWSRASIQASFAGFTGVSDPLPPQQQQQPPQPQHPLQQRQQQQLPLRQQQH